MSVRAWVTRETIEPARILELVGSAEDGAALLFLGIVRDHSGSRRVSGMRYDAYGPMAEKVLDAIAREAAARMGSDRLAVVHRVGELGVGEPSVAIAASSPHRAEAFDAVRYVIEEIKKRLPVWKLEHFEDGGSHWVNAGTASAEAAHE
jgi:molybdopterin synthase catalytic subunit